MEVNKQIEEMAKIMCGITKDCRDCKYHYDVYFSEFRPCRSLEDAEQIYNARYRKQINGKWLERKHEEWFGSETYETHTYYHCSICDGFSKRMTNFCPDCGAKMTGGVQT